MSRQQYQGLESKGNPRLNPLELIAEGLKSELAFVPQEKLNTVLALITEHPATSIEQRQVVKVNKKPLADDPWQGLLGEVKVI